MKKVVILLCVTLFILASCSPSSDTSTTDIPNSLVLVRKTIATFNNGTPQTALTVYNYNKIISVTSPNEKFLYTYTGDLITKVEIYQGVVLKKSTLYAYENNKVKSILTTTINTNSPNSPNSVNKIYYTHINNNSISYKKYDINANNVENLSEEGLLTFLNGNLIFQEGENRPVSTIASLKYTTTNEFDNKINPMKNILGYNLLIDDQVAASLNNNTKSTRVVEQKIMGQTTTQTGITTIQYEYNSDNYPTRRIQSAVSQFGTFVDDSQIFYQ